MFTNAFEYETLGTPSELRPGERVAGYIAPGTRVWERNERRAPLWQRILVRVLFAGWRS